MNSSFILPPEIVEIDKRRKRKNRLIILMVIAGIVILCTAFYFLVTTIMESTDAYKVAKVAIENDSKIVNATGGIEDVSISNGEISTSGSGGNAALYMDVDGVTKDVEVFIRLEQQPLRDWEVVEMVYE